MIARPSPRTRSAVSPHFVQVQAARLVVGAPLLLGVLAVALRRLALLDLAILRRHGLRLLAEDESLKGRHASLEVFDLGLGGLYARAPWAVVFVVCRTHSQRLIMVKICCRSIKRRDHKILQNTRPYAGRLPARRSLHRLQVDAFEEHHELRSFQDDALGARLERGQLEPTALQPLAVQDETAAIPEEDRPARPT